jgi:cytochrome c oxidase subunit 4
MVLTTLTVWVAYQDFGPLNDVIALAIATTKAGLVVWYFMHLRHSSALPKIALAASLAFFLLLVLFVFADVWSRGLFESATGLVPRP